LQARRYNGSTGTPARTKEADAMNIDERIEALTARHEALTQTVELIAAMQQDNERRWEERWGEISTALQQDGEHIRALVRVAELHHERLERLEGPH
jgi:hypothetical protein